MDYKDNILLVMQFVSNEEFVKAVLIKLYELGGS